jgi:hypothetical protein
VRIVDPQHSLPDDQPLAGEEASSEINWFQRDRADRAGGRAGAHHAEAPDDLPGTLHTRFGVIGPRSGQPLPPLPSELSVGSSTQETPLYQAGAVDRDTLRRARGGLLRLGDGVYRGRRPALAVLLAVLTVLFEVAAFRVFATSFRHTSVSGTIASTLMIIALPMFAIGIYALAGGAAVAPGQGVRAWMRTPLAYLPLGLILFLAASLAAGAAA